MLPTLLDVSEHIALEIVAQVLRNNLQKVCITMRILFKKICLLKLFGLKEKCKSLEMCIEEIPWENHK